ncbi:MAG: hypothetical protein K6A39_06470 [Clostridiales bacterium]|nr:hypothetical protein [Clostridiales bacterium]
MAAASGEKNESKVDRIAIATSSAETIDFFGQNVPTDSKLLTLNGYELTDAEFAALYDLIPRFPLLKKLELLHTGRSNEELAALNDAFPSVRVVWTVKLGRRWELRTDTVYFSTKHSPQERHKKDRLKTEDIEVLKYCTDLEGLDLGHHSIDDISVLTSLKKLRVLIVIDNRVSDLTPLSELTELEYLELFLLRVTDVSPLANLKKLKHLNLAHNRLGKSDISPLCTMTGLERLWVNCCGLSKAQQEEIVHALPNTKIEFREYESTGAGWRKHPVYLYLREIFQYG